MTDETLEPTLPGTDAGETQPPDSAPTVRQFGNYRLLEKIGEGGMGEVWAAEQLRPIRRRVAVKVIKQGMDSKQVVARFESERQALAMMDHPNIAKALDAGTTPRGRPYFVMEYVKGIQISKYCDKNRLGMARRLELFIKVCEGVQHAHQKAIIHRDIKPSNIMITVVGDEPVPKIIDFGVAKATAQRLTEKTMFTELGQLIGTPEYMSPEQAEMTGANIDTRTDVYALGVVLYELLVGALPFDSAELRKAGFDGIRKQIREIDPQRPSTRLSKLGDKSTMSARNRHTDTRSLSSDLKGDLDWITMKALEKDRTRRYGSPAELAADVRRHLNHEPVLAGPPSAIYKTRKFVRRHRLGVSFAALVLVLLVGFAVTMTIQAGRIARERDRANQEAETARQVSNFMIDLFEMSDPNEALGNTVTVREILDKGALTIRNELKDQPIVLARMMDTIGDVYGKLGLYDQGRPLLEESLKTLEQEVGTDDLEVSRNLGHLGLLLVKTGEYDDARTVLDRALTIRRQHLGDDDPEVAYVLGNLGQLEYQTGNFDVAREHYEKALDLLEQAHGPSHPEVARMVANQAMVAQQTGDPGKARALYERSLRIFEDAYGGDHPAVARTLNSLAELARGSKQYDEARPLHERALAIREKVFGPDHPDVANSLNNLGILLELAGDYPEARDYHERALGIRETRFGPDHPAVGQSLGNLAIVYKSMGDYENAVPRYQRALAILEAKLGREHRRVANGYYNLAGVVALKGDPAASIELLRQALERGFANRYIFEDTDFDSLRGKPEFQEILSEVQRRLSPSPNRRYSCN